MTPLSCDGNHTDVWLCHWLTGGTGTRLEGLSLCRVPLSVISVFSSCLLWSSLSPVREKGDRGTSCEGQLGLMEMLLRLYRAEDMGLKTVIPSLTLVIMGALFDLRSAPPPAPAHWSTSIRSILWSTGPTAAAPSAGLQPLDGGYGLYLSPVEARPAGLASSKPRAAESAGGTAKLASLYRISSRKSYYPRVTAGYGDIYDPQLASLAVPLT